VKTVQSEPFFANPAHAGITSQLDILQERGVMVVQGESMAVPCGRKKKGSKSHACR
jgi:hypothetical protein